MILQVERRWRNLGIFTVHGFRFCKWDVAATATRFYSSPKGWIRIYLKVWKIYQDISEVVSSAPKITCLDKKDHHPFPFSMFLGVLCWISKKDVCLEDSVFGSMMVVPLQKWKISWHRLIVLQNLWFYPTMGNNKEDVFRINLFCIVLPSKYWRKMIQFDLSNWVGKKTTHDRCGIRSTCQVPRDVFCGSLPEGKKTWKMTW